MKRLLDFDKARFKIRDIEVSSSDISKLDGTGMVKGYRVDMPWTYTPIVGCMVSLIPQEGLKYTRSCRLRSAGEPD